MSIGTSGRIVIEIEPELKRNLYSNLVAQGLTLKEWFLTNAESFIRDADQLQLITNAHEVAPASPKQKSTTVYDEI